MPKLYTREQVALDLLNCSVRQVDRYKALGLLRPTKLGRSVRFSQEAVDDLLMILNPPAARKGGRPAKKAS